ncbi:HEPN domain-containing protein [Methanoculleus sp. FWC-SCC1]|uniref:HEPN domain-containing protein n=1 Tax=Methanoculleus frigidifontis TaxID=2584085 RepID=A0ABT8MC03_9EURY|nr:HEPN domain-containing protein [Methanoculleus sp. FWC-SCC1]MDN7025448.1 HEPN domain-containing protein [Methanoculleus sp. FWC-SCC1]
MRDRLSWCAGVKNGIVFVEPSDNLAGAYLKKAEDAMDAMHSVASFDWKISAGYYSLYFSLYAVLMKIGIRSENHTCTIEVMQRLLGDYFTSEECEMLEKARRARVETQYYVASSVSETVSGTLTKRVPRFLVKCRSVVDGLDEKQVLHLRGLLSNLIEGGRHPR